MSRPVGVTASAVVAILGSTFALVIAGVMVASLFIWTPPAQPPNSTQIAIAGTAMFGALAGIGLWTSVGLFRLRSWARTSILVFAGFTAACCVFGLLMAIAVPIPPTMPPGTEHSFRREMVVVFSIPFAIAVWWLVQFNTRSTKAAFASPMAEGMSPRPMSITVIAWFSIIGGASYLLPLLMRAPAFLFGASFNGWTAGVYYAIFAALSLYIGKGLLDLRERARLVAIGWYGFSLAHVGIVGLVPPLRQRMLELQRAMEREQHSPAPFDPGMMTNVMLAVAAILAATAIWFLIRNRAAFARGGDGPLLPSLGS